MLRILGCLLIILVLAGCAKNPATGKYDLMIVSEKDEFNIGHDVVSEYIQREGLYKKDKAFQHYYQDLAEKLVGVTERKDKPFEFIMLDSNEINAWAVPGYINMYRGVMPFFNSEAEFMGVMAHEAGHITARHAVRKRSARVFTELGVNLGSGLLGIYANSQQVADHAAAAGLFAAQVGFSKFSRTNEYQADMLSLRYLERLGYDPREIIDVFKTLKRSDDLIYKIYMAMNDGKKPPHNPFYDLLKSHPDAIHRIRKTELRVGSWDEDLNQGQDRYYEMIDGMSFGPNFRIAGVAGARDLYLPEDRLKLTFPEGYYLDYNGAWKAVNRSAAIQVSINVSSVDKHQDPEETMRIFFPELRQFEEIKAAGLFGYTAIGYFEKSGDKIRVIGLKGSESIDGEEKTKGSKFYSIVLRIKNVDTREGTAEEHEENFLKAVKSAQLLTADQAKRIQPLRVHIATVQKGETVASLSEKMAFGDFKEDWFRVLNGLDEDDILQNGQKIKLVVDPNTGKI